MFTIVWETEQQIALVRKFQITIKTLTKQTIWIRFFLRLPCFSVRDSFRNCRTFFGYRKMQIILGYLMNDIHLTIEWYDGHWRATIKNTVRFKFRFNFMITFNSLCIYIDRFKWIKLSIKVNNMIEPKLFDCHNMILLEIKIQV